MSGGFIGMEGIDSSPVPEGGTWDAWLGYQPPNVLGQLQFIADQPDNQGGWANYEGSAWYIGAGGGGDQTRPLVLAVGLFPQAGSGEVANTIELAATGVYNQHYTNVANQIAPYWPSAIIRPGWEFNGTWYPWSRSLAADQTNYAAHYVATFNEIVSCFLAVSNQFTFLFNPNLSPFWDSQPPWDCYPGSTCQGVGIDAYDQPDSSHPVAQDRWNAWQGPALGILASQCATWNQPACIPEWGAGAVGDNPLYVDLMSQWCLAQPAPCLQCYWNNDASYAGALNDYPNQKQQYFLNWRNPWISWPSSVTLTPKAAPAAPKPIIKPANSKLVTPPAKRLVKWKAA